MCCSGVTAMLFESVCFAACGDAYLFGHRRRYSLERRGHDEVGDVASLDAGVRKCPRGYGGDYLQIAFVAYPAFFPEVVVIVVA